MKMAIAKSVLVAAAALVVSACGAPGHEFLGLYAQNGTVTFTANGGSATGSLSGNVNIVEGSSSDLLIDAGDCMLPFNSDEFESATIVPSSTCTSTTSDGYTILMTFRTGVANLTGKSVSTNLSGSITVTTPDGATFPGTFTWNSTLTKLGK